MIPVERTECWQFGGTHCGCLFVRWYMSKRRKLTETECEVLSRNPAVKVAQPNRFVLHFEFRKVLYECLLIKNHFLFWIRKYLISTTWNIYLRKTLISAASSKNDLSDITDPVTIRKSATSRTNLTNLNGRCAFRVENLTLHDNRKPHNEEFSTMVFSYYIAS